MSEDNLLQVDVTDGNLDIKLFSSLFHLIASSVQPENNTSETDVALCYRLWYYTCIKWMDGICLQGLFAKKSTLSIPHLDQRGQYSVKMPGTSNCYVIHGTTLSPDTSIILVLPCSEVNQTVIIGVCKRCQTDLSDCLNRKTQLPSHVLDNLIELLLTVDSLENTT